MFEFLNRPKIDTADAAPAEGKASATGHAIAWPGAGRVAWSPRDVVSLTRTGFIGNPVGFRAVKITAEAAAALPVVLQELRDPPNSSAFGPPKCRTGARGNS